MTRIIAMTRKELIAAFWGGGIGEVEFAEVGLDLGMTLAEIGEVLAEVRAEDGILENAEA